MTPLDEPRSPPPPEPSGPFSRFRASLVARLKARGSYPSWVLFASLAGVFASGFPITILTVSLGPIAEEFGARETAVAWVLSAPLLLSGVALPLLGKLGDLHGHRRVFLLGFGAATVAASATAFAWNLPSLIGLRTIAAVVGGATQPAAMALILSVHRPEDRVRAMGWWSMTGAAAPAFGLIAGGPLVDWLGWRVVFLVQACLSAIALLLASVVLSETPRKRARFDVAGAAALAVGVGGLMYAVSQLRELGDGSPYFWLGIVGGAIGIWAFVRIERRAATPLLPLEFFRRPNFSASIASNAFHSAAYMGSFSISPLLYVKLFGYSVTATAAVMLMRTASLTIASPIGGRLGARIGERRTALLGGSVMTFGLLLIAAGAYGLSRFAIEVGLVLQGLGHGLTQPVLASATAGAVDDEDLGVAAAANRLTGQMGVAFGITTLTMVYGGIDTGGSFATAFLVGAALSVASLTLALFMSVRDRVKEAHLVPEPLALGAEEQG
ncbi:MAG: multidrug efflux MFS transporter [Deltaproteobacteria bacterium]|nr:multidrug efflux MFS transporter [Deltaproteobacteria bacterium]